MKFIEKLKDYFKHTIDIPIGKSGEFSKVTEEYMELMDAYSQGKKYFTVVEAADLVTVLGEFTRKKFKVPLILVVLFAYLRIPYKWIRNPFLRRKYKLSKAEAFESIERTYITINNKDMGTQLAISDKTLESGALNEIAYVVRRGRK